MNRILILFFLLSTFSVASQETIDEVLEKHNVKRVPYLKVDDLSKLTDVILLDAREREEFEVSHLKNAIFVGYDNFDLDATMAKLDSVNTPIVVYCSIGVRSKKITKKLKKAGVENVYNLYGGIFDWKNKNFTVVDTNNIATEKVHAYSKFWGKFLKNGEKVLPEKQQEETPEQYKK
jgi:rhodanese-related sulfurtransferase